MPEIPTSCARVAKLILDGITTTGGATVPVRERVSVPGHGYLIGGAVPERIVPWADQHTLWNVSTRDRRKALYEAAADFALENWLRITAYPGFRAIGAWLDRETGYVHLDVSDWRNSLREAVELGNGRKELAIWDLKQQREIPLLSLVTLPTLR